MSHRKYLPNSPTCFVCGVDNPAGLRARFYVEQDVVKMPLNVHHHHCGYPNTLHGGVVAAALDECMAWAATRAFKRMCVTGQITVRYIKRVPADKPLTVCAEVILPHRRMVHAKGSIVDAEGTEYARAEGKFLPLTAEETLDIDDWMIYNGGEERIFDELRAERA